MTRKQFLAALPACVLTVAAVALVGLSVAEAARGSVAPAPTTAVVASDVAPATSTRDWEELRASQTTIRFR